MFHACHSLFDQRWKLPVLKWKHIKTSDSWDVLKIAECRRDQGERRSQSRGENTLFWGKNQEESGSGDTDANVLRHLQSSDTVCDPRVSALTGPGGHLGQPHVYTPGQGIQKAKGKGCGLENHMHGGRTSENDCFCLTRSEIHVFSFLFLQCVRPPFYNLWLEIVFGYSEN